ncbi:MAG: DMT family transporter [Epsilonproteobacteria bacterium]|nr:DMT family transporter [Campylobacterota bacterium]
MILLVVFLYALLAATFICAKQTVMYGDPFFVITIRMMIAGLMLLGYQAVRAGSLKVVKLEDWWLFARTTFFHIYFAYTLEFWALQYVTALKTTLIYSATPFVAAFLSHVLLKERLSLIQKGGMLVGVLGLGPVLYMQSGGEQMLFDLLNISVPEAVLFMSMISAAYAWFLVKQLMAKGYSVLTINGMSMLGGGFACFITTLFASDLSNMVYDWPQFLMWLVFLIFSANIAFYNLYGYLLSLYSLTFVTFCGFLCPIFATLFDWLFMGGIITWHYFLTIACITLGLWMFSYGDKLKKIVTTDKV